MQEKCTFQGGLNSDDDILALPPGDYIDAVNIRNGITDDGNNFSIENTKGNVKIFYQLPAGDSKTIGAYKHDLTSTVTYFNYNNAGNHHILQYSWITGIISQIALDPKLDFDVNHKITGINIIGDLLYWTDNFKEPRKINYVKAINGTGPYNPNTLTSDELEEFIYAIKSPPLFPPTTSFFTDPTKTVNYLTGFVFQFKYRYYYDDFEKSATSPISTISLPNLNYSSFSDIYVNNRLDIVINTGSAIVTKIEILARIGNIGDFFSIVILDKNDKYFPITTTTFTYQFYNDGTYNNIDVRESDKLFDNVPLLAKSQDLIDPTRLTYGDITEGFDPVDIVAKLEVDVSSAVPNNVYNINIGRIFIYNPFTGPADVFGHPMGQPIIDQKGDGTAVFGGFYKNTSGTWLLNSPNNMLEFNYGQVLPLGGFVFYLAGTNYYGVSRQNSLIGAPNLSEANGAYSITTNGVVDQNKVGYVGTGIYSGFVYSTAAIKNVPEGKYVLRVADHNTTQAEINSGTLEYQKRSTYLGGFLQYGGYGAQGPGQKEVTIEISAISILIDGVPYIVNPLFPQDINIAQGVSEEVAIFDLSSPQTGTYSNALSGYILDQDIALPVSPTLADLYAETRVHLAQISFQTNYETFLGFNQNDTLYQWLNGITYADHNGFFFAAGNFLNSNPNQLSILGAIQSGNTVATTLNYDTNGTAISYTSGPYNNRVLSITSTSGQLNNERTLINGQITNGNASSSVVITRSQWEFIDQFGNYSIPVYNDTSQLVYNGVIINRTESIIYTSNGSVVIFTPDKDLFDIAINSGAIAQTVFVSPYNGVYNYTYQLTTVLVTYVALNVIKTGGLKRAGWYQYGIVYYDHGNRSGVTNTNDYASESTSFSGKTDLYGLKLYVPYYTEPNPSNNNIVWGGSSPIINWSIYNRPPEWATHYQWVRTLNSANNDYVQFVANNIEYIDDAGAVSSFLVGTKIRIDVTNIENGYKAVNPNSKLKYTFISEPTVDHIRFIREANGNFFIQYIDLQVLSYDNQYIVIENRAGLSDFTNQAGFLFEIYNPKQQIADANKLFWEIGECFEVGDSGLSTRYHKGLTQDQSTTFNTNYKNIPISIIPATGSFNGGDTYYRIRNMPYGGAKKSTYIIEDASISDFYLSKVSDIGRPNKVQSDFRRINRPSTIYYSELYIPETNINNLNSFYDINFETYEQKYGSIQKLYNENHRLIVLQQLKVGQIPVNQSIVYDNTGVGQIYSVSKVLGDIIYYAGEYGMTNPESFTVYGGSKYFVDENRGVPLRLSAGGLDPIHENNTKQIKMHTYFTNKLAVYEKNSNSFMYGVYDKAFGNYVLSFEEITGVVDGETIVFDELSNRWKSKFSYNPDYMCVANETIVSFKDGDIYLHNDTSVGYDQFYGAPYESSITTVAHQNPSKEKTIQAISQESSNNWSAVITTEHGQQADVIDGDFQLIENMQYAPVSRDLNTPNIINPGIEGDVLRDTAFIVKLTNGLKTFTKLFAINILYSDSDRSNK